MLRTPLFYRRARACPSPCLDRGGQAPALRCGANAVFYRRARACPSPCLDRGADLCSSGAPAPDRVRSVWQICQSFRRSCPTGYWGKQRSRGTGPRATVMRDVRGGNPLGCAYGIRGPPRYGEKTLLLYVGRGPVPRHASIAGPISVVRERLLPIGSRSGDLDLQMIGVSGDRGGQAPALRCGGMFAGDRPPRYGEKNPLLYVGRGPVPRHASIAGPISVVRERLLPIGSRSGDLDLQMIGVSGDRGGQAPALRCVDNAVFFRRLTHHLAERDQSHQHPPLLAP